MASYSYRVQIRGSEAHVWGAGSGPIQAARLDADGAVRLARALVAEMTPGAEARIERRRNDGARGGADKSWLPYRSYDVGSDGIVRRNDC